MTDDNDKRTRRDHMDNTANKGDPDEERSRPSDWIARHLKDVYDETVREPLPKKLVELLDKLDKRH